MDKVEQLKMILQEKSVPFFTEEELELYLEIFGNDVKKTAYHCLLLKAQNNSLNVSGLTTQDSSSYFKMLAQQYITTNSGVL